MQKEKIFKNTFFEIWPGRWALYLKIKFEVMVKEMVFSFFLDFESIKNQLIGQFYIKNVMVQDFLSSFVFLVNDSVILPKKIDFFFLKN